MLCVSVPGTLEGLEEKVRDVPGRRDRPPIWKCWGGSNPAYFGSVGFHPCLIWDVEINNDGVIMPDPFASHPYKIS